MVLGKLLAFLRRRKKPYLIVRMSPGQLPEFVIIPPEQQNAYQEQDIEAEEEGEELCEEPKPLKTFHAANPQIALEKAAAKNLIILYAGRERWDLYKRSHIYFALTKEFALKLIQLENDMKSEKEFTHEEQTILKDLTVKGWVKRLQNGGVYYYGLNKRTATILKKQIAMTRNQIF
jgi:hypothetical protein